MWKDTLPHRRHLEEERRKGGGGEEKGGQREEGRVRWSEMSGDTPPGPVSRLSGAALDGRAEVFSDNVRRVRLVVALAETRGTLGHLRRKQKRKREESEVRYRASGAVSAHGRPWWAMAKSVRARSIRIRMRIAAGRCAAGDDAARSGPGGGQARGEEAARAPTLGCLVF